MTINISFIGSGRVATHLATQLSKQQSILIQQIFSQNIAHATCLAQKVSATAIVDLSELKSVDILIIAVTDAAIALIAQQLSQLNYQGLVIHTSGSTSLDILTQYNLRAGVFYPLQTFSPQQSIDWLNTPIFLESALENDLMLLNKIAQSLSSHIYYYDSAQRLSLHLAAVFACNFSNYCYDIAQQILLDRKVDTDLLLPLILQTAHKLQFSNAIENQTGPAARHDTNIMDLHLNLLNQQPDWQKIYQLMSNEIQKRHPK